MKKVIICSLLGLSTLFVSINHSKAQTTAKLSTIDEIQNTKLAHTLNNEKSYSKTDALLINEVSTKAIRTFGRNYKEVSNQQWYPIDKNKYLVTFTSKDGRNSRALLANSGYLYYGINYGNEESLTKEQRKQIKSMYFDYNIGLVCEIIADGQKIWVIQLEDKDNLATVRLTSDGMLDELETFKKQSLKKKQ